MDKVRKKTLKVTKKEKVKVNDLPVAGEVGKRVKGGAPRDTATGQKS